MLRKITQFNMVGACVCVSGNSALQCVPISNCSTHSCTHFNMAYLKKATESQQECGLQKQNLKWFLMKMSDALRVRVCVCYTYVACTATVIRLQCAHAHTHTHK